MTLKKSIFLFLFHMCFIDIIKLYYVFKIKG